MEKEKYIETEKIRAEIFNIFSSLMCEPEEDIAFNKELFLKIESYLNYFNVDSKFTSLINELSKYDLQQLRIEHTRLFLGPFSVPAQPYGSLYLGEKTLMGETTMWVQKFYESTGVEFDHEIKDLPDHAIVETEFIYYLTYQTLSAIENGKREDALFYNERLKTFTEQHYNKWMPQFCEKVVECSELNYFTIIFKCFYSFISKSKIPNLPT